MLQWFKLSELSAEETVYVAYIVQVLYVTTDVPDDDAMVVVMMIIRCRRTCSRAVSHMARPLTVTARDVVSLRWLVAYDGGAVKMAWHKRAVWRRDLRTTDHYNIKSNQTEYA